jgi:hypothetical protein
MPDKIAPSNSDVEELLEQKYDPEAFSAITGKDLSIPSDDNTGKDGTSEDTETSKKEAGTEEKVEGEVKDEEAEKASKEVSEEVPITALPLETLGLPQKKDEILEFDLTEAEQTFIKQMSKPAKEFVLARLKEGKEPKAKAQELEQSVSKEGELPRTWYEHPNAYVLDPRFQQVQQSYNQLVGVKAHYEAQLRKVKEGEQWDDLTVDPQGNLQVIKKEASTEAEGVLANRIAEANVRSQQVASQAQQLASTYQQRVSDALGEMRKVEDTYFPQFKDAKTIEADKNIQAIKKVLRDRGLETNVLSGMVAKLYAWGAQATSELKKARAEQLKQTTIENIQKAAGPSSSEITNSASSSTTTKDPNKIPFMADKFNEMLGI